MSLEINSSRGLLTHCEVLEVHGIFASLIVMIRIEHHAHTHPFNRGNHNSKIFQPEYVCSGEIQPGMNLLPVSYTHLDVYKRQIFVFNYIQVDKSL